MYEPEMPTQIHVQSLRRRDQTATPPWSSAIQGSSEMRRCAMPSLAPPPAIPRKSISDPSVLDMGTTPESTQSRPLRGPVISTRPWWNRAKRGHAGQAAGGTRGRSLVAMLSFGWLSLSRATNGAKRTASRAACVLACISREPESSMPCVLAATNMMPPSTCRFHVEIPAKIGVDSAALSAWRRILAAMPHRQGSFAVLVASARAACSTSQEGMGGR